MNFSGTIVCPNCLKNMTGSGGQHGPMGVSTLRKCWCGMSAILYKASNDCELEAKFVLKVKNSYTNDYKNLFIASNINILGCYEITNEYNRESEPWFLVKIDTQTSVGNWRLCD